MLNSSIGVSLYTGRPPWVLIRQSHAIAPLLPQVAGMSCDPQPSNLDEMYSLMHDLCVVYTESHDPLQQRLRGYADIQYACATVCRASCKHIR